VGVGSFVVDAFVFGGFFAAAGASVPRVLLDGADAQVLLAVVERVAVDVVDDVGAAGAEIEDLFMEAEPVGGFVVGDPAEGVVVAARVDGDEPGVQAEAGVVVVVHEGVVV